MHRIDAADNVGNRFADPDPIEGTQGTQFDAAFMNAIQEELATFMEYMGITLVKGNNTQLRQAVLALLARANAWTGVQTFSGQVAVDGAAANAGTVANAIRFGGAASGEAIGSQRAASGGNQWGIDIYTNSVKRVSVAQNGAIDVHGNTIANVANPVNGADAVNLQTLSSKFPAPSWILPVIGAGWTNGSGESAVGYWRDSCGIVHFKGYATSAASSTVLFTLPSGSRPKAARKLKALDSTNGGDVIVQIDANGDVRSMGHSYPDAIYFDQMSFVAEQ